MDIVSVLAPDAIPSIDDPQFDDEYLGDEDDDVIVIDASPVRAYPVRILNFHEIVNDVVDGNPIAVTWCPLCASAVVYDRRIDGRQLSFGVSGKLADDDLVMYDRETGSEWKQSLGVCIAGEFEGSQLEVLPASMMTWGRFTHEYPAGIVLQPDDSMSEAASDDDQPAPVDYSMDPYNAYFESSGIGLAAHRGEANNRTWQRKDIHPKEIVLGIEYDGEAIGVPLNALEHAGGFAEIDIGTTSVIAIVVDGAPYVYEHPGFEIEYVDGRLRGDGTSWDPVTGSGADGRQLDRAPTRRMFAFTWQDDYGPDAFFDQTG